MKRIISLIISLMMILTGVMPLNTMAANQDYVFFDSFESDFKELPSGWDYFGEASKGNVKIENSKASDGKNSVHITDSSTTASAGIQCKTFKAEAKKQYTMDIDIYNISGKCSAFLKFFDASDKQIFTKSVVNSNVGNWTTVSLTDTAPEGTVKGSIVLCVINASTGDVLYDNVRVYEGAKRTGQTPATQAPATQAPATEAPATEAPATQAPVGNSSPEIGSIPVQSAPVNAKLVAPDGANLKYSTYNEQGDKISDFSYAGFYAGEIELPVTKNLPVIATVSPSTDPKADDTARIQKIIDSASTMIAAGQMGVVKFEAGRYNVNKSGISVKSGIVLSGSGQGPNGTVIYATDASQYAVVKAAGVAPVKISKEAYITDDYVKVGSDEINISSEDIANFKVGDVITVYHPSSAEWNKGVEMENVISTTGTNNSWTEGKVDMPTERTIKAINGTTITLSFPMFVPLNKKYAKSYIYKVDDSQRVSNFGIENLRIESYYNGKADDEQHANVAVSIISAKNGFVRDVVAKHFILSAVRCGSFSKQITVKNCSSLEPISQVAGSRRYTFSCTTSAQQILFTGCYSYAGRHDYMSSYSSTGPLSFVDNVVEASTNASETHGTWTTGLLYDNVYHLQPQTRGFIAFSNRGVYGTSLSQGWSGAGCVAWNTLTSTLIAHKPSLTYQNFMVGTWGRYLDSAAMSAKSSNISAFTAIYRTSNLKNASAEQFKTSNTTPFTGDAYREAETTPVEPRSLFKAQLALRITGDYRNTKPNAPIIVNPKPDSTENSMKVTGIYQLGAEKVTVYVDDKATDAVLNSTDNTFSATVSASAGWHKIYATQTVSGVEGTKNADRFIKIGSAEDKSNPEYLQSIYDKEKTAMITADKRNTFDASIPDVKIDDSIKVILNGTQLKTDVAPIEMNGRVLVPMRAIFEGLGSTVEWDEATATATGKKGDLTVKITENSSTAYVNGNATTLDVSATIIDGRFLVPVRFISESLGAKVNWIDQTKTVTIETDSAKAGVYSPKNNIPNALTVYGLKASGDDGAGSVIEQCIDGALNTRWSVSGKDESKAWAIFDLGEEKTLAQAYLAFHSGDKRVYTFSIAVSTDGKNYTTVLDKQNSSGKSKELESYSLNGAKGRYIKFIGGGNSDNDWNSLTEIVFVEQK